MTTPEQSAPHNVSAASLEETWKDRVAPKLEAVGSRAQSLGDAVIESIKKNPGAWVAGAVLGGFVLGRLVSRK